MTNRHSARGLLLAAAVLIPLSGCGSDERLAADDAVGHYDAVADDLSRALGDPDTQWQFIETMRHVKLKGDVCLYMPGLWQPEPRLETLDDAAWEARMQVVNPVLEQHGFEAVDTIARAESAKFLESSDEHGAVLRIEDGGGIYLYDAAVDADPCDLTALAGSSQ